MEKQKFDPFYDSDFLISHEGSDERRLLVELPKDELLRLQFEINETLKTLDRFEGMALGA